MEWFITQQQLFDMVGEKQSGEGGKCSDMAGSWDQAECKQSGRTLRPWRRLGSRAPLLCVLLTCKKRPQGLEATFLNWTDGLQGPESLSKMHLTSSPAGQEPSGNRALRAGKGGGYGRGAQRRADQAPQMCLRSWLRLNPLATDSDQINTLGRGPVECLC